MNISGPAAVAKPEMLFYAPGDLTVTPKLQLTRYDKDDMSITAPSVIVDQEEQILASLW